MKTRSAIRMCGLWCVALGAVLAASLALPPAAVAQGGGDPKALLDAQREAMRPLAFLDGAWRGNAWALLPTGEKHEVTQTERVGPFLDGTIRVIEGRGYTADGTVSFNALGIVSYDPAKQAYTIRSHAMGRAGDFAMKPAADGFTWEIPAGPMTIRYTATVKDGTWHEVGDRIVPGKDPVRFFEMTLKRIGDSDWPSAGAIPMK